VEIEPPFPPALYRLRLLQVKVLEISSGLDTDAASLEDLASATVPLEEEQFLLEALVGVDAQEALTKHHKSYHLHDDVRCEVMKL
jgi:hypothetical protein